MFAITVRIGPDLHDRLAERARAEHRSVSAMAALMIEDGLDDTLTAGPGGTMPGAATLPA
jgi:hypothetical protein